MQSRELRERQGINPNILIRFDTDPDQDDFAL